MKLNNSKLFIFISMLFFSTTTIKMQAQWNSIDGPAVQAGVYTVGVGTINNRAFIGQNIGIDFDIKFGLFEILNNGRSLKRVENVGVISNGFGFASDEETIFFGIEGGIVISKDKGDNWEKYIYAMFGEEQVGALFVEGDTMFVTSAGKLFRSFNKGTTWMELAKKSNQSFNCSNIIKVNQKLFKADDWELLKSDDWGETWSVVGGGVWSRMNNLLYDGSRLYITAQAGLFISYDQGQSFTFVEIGALWLNSITKRNGIMLIGTSLDDHIYRSTDDGITWTGTPSPLINNYVLSLASTDSVFYSGGDDGFLYSIDDGINWHLVQAIRIPSKKIILNDNSIIAATSSGLFSLTNSDPIWDPINNTVIFKGTNDFLVDDSVIYAANDLGLNKSENNGKSWTTFGFANNTVKSISKNGDDFFAGTSEEGIFFTNTDGKLWINRSYGLPKNMYDVYNPISTILSTQSITISSVAGYGIYWSEDKGIKWTKSAGITDDIVKSVVQVNNDFFAGSELGVYKSVDNGKSWAKIADPPSSFDISCLFYNNEYLFAGSLYGGVSIYDQTRDNWLSINYGLPSQIITAITGDEDSLFVSTQSYGIYKRNIKSYLSNELISSNEFKIFPNPCKDILCIETKLIDKSECDIRIQNAEGKIISTSHSSCQNGKCEMNVSDLLPGSYCISLSYNNVWHSFQFIKI